MFLIINYFRDRQAGCCKILFGNNETLFQRDSKDVRMCDVLCGEGKYLHF